MLSVDGTDVQQWRKAKRHNSQFEKADVIREEDEDEENEDEAGRARA